MFKKFFFYFIAFLFLCACSGSSQINLSVIDEIEKTPFKNENLQKQILDLSDEVYSGSQKCVDVVECENTCNRMYTLSSLSRENCKQLKAQQVFQLEKLSNIFLEKKLSSLKSVNVFDLKIFFNVEKESLFHFFKSLDLFSLKIFLHWIVLDWQVAQIFQEEDQQQVFLKLFLKKLSHSPIDSLREPIFSNRTFIELAWLKQNDPALLWVYNYFQANQCAQAKELENCMLTQYCLLSDSFKEDVLTEFMDFKPIRNLVKKEGDINFKTFCSDFCLSKGNNYC